MLMIVFELDPSSSEMCSICSSTTNSITRRFCDISMRTSATNIWNYSRIRTSTQWSTTAEVSGHMAVVPESPHSHDQMLKWSHKDISRSCWVTHWVMVNVTGLVILHDLLYQPRKRGDKVLTITTGKWMILTLKFTRMEITTPWQRTSDKKTFSILYH
jgi:hypothetical protein